MFSFSSSASSRFYASGGPQGMWPPTGCFASFLKASAAVVMVTGDGKSPLSFEQLIVTPLAGLINLMGRHQRATQRAFSKLKCHRARGRGGRSVSRLLHNKDTHTHTHTQHTTYTLPKSFSSPLQCIGVPLL